MSNNTINTIVCSECGAVIDFPFEGHIYNGEHICDNCYNQYFTMCYHCGSIERNVDVTYINGRDYCDECRDRFFFLCDHCNEYERTMYQHTVRNEHGEFENWCYSCRTNDAWTCDECGSVYSDDVPSFQHNDSYFCEECHERYIQQSDINNWRAPSGVKNYSYKPVPCFCPEPDDSEIFYGYELEMEAHDNDRNEAADIINDTLGYTYCKHDGSLDDGIEVVSHPATLQYHMDMKDTYTELFSDLSIEGWRSHDDGTCGLHVHISKEAMELKNPYAVANLLIFFDNHWNRLVNFSRRNEGQLERWAQRFSKKGLMYHRIAKIARDLDDRYMAVNLQNSHTVEIRMFRGTLNATTFFATLQLVDVLVKKAIEIGTDFDAANSIGWNDLVRSDHEELITYLKKRKLYNIDNDEPESDDDIGHEDVETQVESEHGFKIGDRVIFRIPRGASGYSHDLYGHTNEDLYGTVRAFNDMNSDLPIGVELDNEFGYLHDLRGAIDTNNGQWCMISHLRHVIPSDGDIGHRVRIGENIDGLIGCAAAGRTGTLVGLGHGDAFAVRIDGDWNGHDCNGHCPDNNGYWVHRDILFLIED